MATVTSMTTEQLTSLPDDGIERDLVRGELRERPMTKRSRRHSRVELKLGFLLRQWLERQPEPRGELLSGEAGIRIRRDPDTTVGVDLAYLSSALSAATPENAVFVDGPPVLAVEILSPSDKQEDILDKVREYLDAGVAQVWLVEPVFQTVTVYRPATDPVLVSAQQELSGDPELPGFAVKVAEIFRK